MTLFNNKNFWLYLGAAITLTAGFVIADQFSLYYLVGLISIILIAVFYQYPMIGLYLMAFLFPFTDLQLKYGAFNAQYVDIFGLFLFIAWSIKAIYGHFSGQEKLTWQNFPGVIFAGLFILAGFLSLQNVDREAFTYCFKYVLRPMGFFYLVFVLMPFNVIKTKQQFLNIFNVMFGLGIVISLMGVWTLIFPPIEGVRRALPVGWGEFYPLGWNHNLLAESLVVIWPAALVLFWYAKDYVRKNIYLLGALLMIGINLLTLSRAGWVSLAAQILILIGFKYRKEIKKYALSPLNFIFVILLAPIFYMMYLISQSHIMLSSDLNRLKMAEIAFHLFTENPWFGKGAGTFMIYLSQVKWYQIEYGTTLDAHGFIIKVMAELGLAGIISFCLLLLYVLFTMYKGYNKSRNSIYEKLVLGMVLVVVGGIVFQTFNTSYYLAKLWLPIGLALGSLKISGYFLKK